MFSAVGPHCASIPPWATVHLWHHLGHPLRWRSLGAPSVGKQSLAPHWPESGGGPQLLEPHVLALGR